MPKTKETREEALARLKREAAGSTLYKGKTKKRPLPASPTTSPASKAARVRREGITKKYLPGMHELSEVLKQPQKKKEH